MYSYMLSFTNQEYMSKELNNYIRASNKKSLDNYLKRINERYENELVIKANNEISQSSVPSPVPKNLLLFFSIISGFSFLAGYYYKTITNK